MSNGWIKLHRKLMDWEWYNNSQMVHLFIHLMMKANHKPMKWRGVLIRRGQILTGRESLSRDTGISIQKIRTCLKRLEATNELTIKLTSRYSLITILNYKEYQQTGLSINQQINQDSNHQLTNNQPTSPEKSAKINHQDQGDTGSDDMNSGEFEEQLTINQPTSPEKSAKINHKQETKEKNDKNNNIKENSSAVFQNELEKFKGNL